MIQARLAAFHGTQCGYCTPGMVMQMNRFKLFSMKYLTIFLDSQKFFFSLLSKSLNPTMSEVESAFDGNLCRCTGYRPILDAFKTFAMDASSNLLDKVPDIEECDKVAI